MTIPERIVAALAGRYVIVREIGRGGMATVYLAEDLRHRRKVAIKVLKDDVSASVGAGRFLREIEIAAQLQHPHILPLLDSGEGGGVLYYVMPYVEAQSLRQRLAREGELPIGDALRILVEIADALAFAHSHGVVHRDIKPDNIMLAGRHAVIADFGVARAVSEAVDGSTLTSLGVALGTPAYMAPEQAVADPHVDQRADIYALGIVAYELLAGRTPFAGGTAQQMLAAHVTERPDPPSKHRPGIAPVLEQALMRCLEKRAADRFQTATELLAILEPLTTPSGGIAPTEARAPRAVRSSGRWRWVAAGLAVSSIAAGAVWQLTRDPPTLQLGRATPVTTDAGLEIQPDISPDGRLVAYATGTFARMRIYIRPVEGGRTIPLSDDSSAVESAPRWSPDGSRILFLVRGGVSVAPSLGGSSRTLIAPATEAVRSAAWSTDGSRVLFVRSDSVFVVPVSGGTPAFLATAPDVHQCAWGPGDAAIACVSENSTSEQLGPNFGNLAPSSIIAFPGTGGAYRPVATGPASNHSPVWSADGRRIFFVSNRDGPRDIYSVQMTRSGAPRGEPQRLTTGLGALSIAISRDGKRLAYAAYSARSNLYTLPIPARGPVSSSGAVPLTTGTQVVEAMRASADGRWILFDSNLGGRSHIWRVPAQGGQPEQLTNGPADEFAPELSPDGRLVVYHSWRTGTRDIEVFPLAGGEPERVTQTSVQESYPTWSPDGNSILFLNQITPYTAFVTTRRATGGWSDPVAIASPALSPRWSPDGRSVVYLDPAQRVFIVPSAGGTPRLVHEPALGAPGSLPRVAWGQDNRLYVKSHDADGRASFWVISPAGGRAELLVRFDDLARPSSRGDFDVDRHRFYFPIEERESDVFVVEIERH